MMQENETRVAVIGAQGHYPYALGAIRNGICKLVGVNDAAVIQRLGSTDATPVFADWRAMLDETKPDIAVVNEIFCENAAIAADCLSRGISVFCEKPLATDTAKLKLLTDAWNAVKPNGVHLAGMFGIRSTPHFYTAKRLLEAGAVGEICLMSAQKSYKLGTRADYYKKRETYGGTIAWIAIHAVDWLHWLSLRGFTSVAASHSTYGNRGCGELEATSACLFTMDGGAIATVTADYLRPSAAPTHDDDRIRVAGTDGVLEIRGGRVFLTDGDGEREMPLENPPSDLFTQFIGAVSGNSPDFSPDGDESLYLTRAALSATEAADRHELINL